MNFIIATPPCQGMSVAGNRDPEDPRNQLISYAIDIIKRVSPDFVMLENVPRQLSTKIRIGGEIIKIPEYIKKNLRKSIYLIEKHWQRRKTLEFHSYVNEI